MCDQRREAGHAAEDLDSWKKWHLNRWNETGAGLVLGTRSSQRFSPGKISLAPSRPGNPPDLVILDVNPVADVRSVRRIRTLAIGGKVLERGDLETALSRVAKAVRAGLDCVSALPDKESFPSITAAEAPKQGMLTSHFRPTGDLGGAAMAAMNGTIKRIVSDKGFGFILATDGNEYFFHNSACTGVRFDDLREGQAVTFERGQGPKGPRAETVKVA